jgi:hypothetical protein
MSKAVADNSGKPRGLVLRFLPVAAMLIVGFGWILCAGQYPGGEGLGKLLGILARTMGPALAYVIPVSAAVYCWSRLIRRFVYAELGTAVAMALGLAVHLWMCWLAGWLGMLSSGVAIGLVAVPVVADFNTRAWGMPIGGRRLDVPWAFAWLGLPVGLLALAAAIPGGLIWAVEAFGYDVLSYHLQLPKEWQQGGHLALYQHNVYSAFPSLGEAGYMHAFAWFDGSLSYSVFACQFLHAATACLAAGVVAQIVWDGMLRLRASGQRDESEEGEERNDWVPGIVAGGVFLALPWVLITGSLAYNEMFALALGGAALAHALGARRVTWRDAIVVGVLAGAGTMAKLTAGPMLAVPAGLLLIMRQGFGAGDRGPVSRVSGPGSKKESPEKNSEYPHAGPLPEGEGDGVGARVKGVVVAILVMVVAGGLVLSPYFVRNFAATGNPVFPFATGVFGTGHWTSEQAQTFARGHAPVGTVGERVNALGRHWLRNAGYGAFNGRELSEMEKRRETRNVAVFQHEYGVPVFWLLVLVGLGVVVAIPGVPGLRWVGVGLGLTILWQAVFWVVGTHIQSRFMIFSLVPGCALLGLGVARLSLVPMRGVARPVGCVLIGFFALHGVQVFWGQTYRTMNPESGRMEAFPACVLVGNLGHAGGMLGSMDEGGMNQLPAGSKVMWVADASRVLYSRGPISYHSAFDTEPLGAILKAHRGDPGAVTAELKKMGLTHVWVHWSELERLHATYGYDKEVTVGSLEPVVRTWRVVEEVSVPGATLFVLP